MTTQSLKIITATELKRKSGHLLCRAAEHDEQFLIKRGGYSIAVLLSFEAYQALTKKDNKQVR